MDISEILMGENPKENILKLYIDGNLVDILPELTNLDITVKGHKNNFYHTLIVLDRAVKGGADLRMRFVALLHDIGKFQTREFIDGEFIFHNHEKVGAAQIRDILLRLGITDDDFIIYVERMVRYHGRLKLLDDVSDSAIRRLDNSVGQDIIFDLIDFCKYDNSTSKPDKLKRICDKLDHIKNRIIEVRKKDENRVWSSPLTGEIIMSILNIKPSVLIGQIKLEFNQRFKDGTITLDEAIEEMKQKYSDLLY